MYNWLKHTAMIALPAIAAFYISLAQLWHFPHPDEVAGSIAALNTLLGVFVGVSTKSYNNSDTKYDGDIIVSDTGDKKTYSLSFNSDPEKTIDNSEAVTLKVTGGK